MTAIYHLFLATLCCTSFAEFLFPGPMGQNGDYVTGVPEWQQGSNQTLKWETNLTYYAITLWQQDYSGSTAASGPQIYTKLTSDPEIGDSTGFEWTVEPKGFDLSKSKVFWLNLRDIYQEAGSFKSTYFNVSAASSSSSTGSSASSTPTASQTQSTASSTASSSPTSQSNDKTTKIALGVGLGIGIPIIALLGAAVWIASKYVRRRFPEESKSTPANAAPRTDWSNKPELSAEFEAKQARWPPTELDGRSHPTELHAFR